MAQNCRREAWKVHVPDLSLLLNRLTIQREQTKKSPWQLFWRGFETGWSLITFIQLSSSVTKQKKLWHLCLIQSSWKTFTQRSLVCFWKVHPQRERFLLQTKSADTGKAGRKYERGTCIAEKNQTGINKTDFHHLSKIKSIKATQKSVWWFHI